MISFKNTYVTGEGQIFVYKCGHREKLSTFTERKNRDKHKKISKGEVSQY
ncbi:hypothetical protein RJD24_07100 [Bacillaceae bacterium IKA-2]|nr:hypothetical protein RJD24_07100 [Bacillaceae bacterium IKA-2]